MSDVGMMLTIISLFVIIGIFLPSVNDAFGGSTTDYQVGSLEDDISGNLNAANTTEYSGLSIATKGVSIVVSILSMFFWTFGGLPAWLDSLFIIPRLMLGFLFARWLRGN